VRDVGPRRTGVRLATIQHRRPLFFSSEWPKTAEHAVRSFSPSPRPVLSIAEKRAQRHSPLVSRKQQSVLRGKPCLGHTLSLFAVWSRSHEIVLGGALAGKRGSQEWGRHTSNRTSGVLATVVDRDPRMRGRVGAQKYIGLRLAICCTTMIS
jgi:hypothetical protein